MVKVRSYDLDKNEESTFDVSSLFFNNNVNKEMLSFVVKDYLHQKRAKTALAKNRAAVRGGGAKPWKQKGTGRARAGTNSSPLWVGGGVIFGPQNIKRTLKVNKKVKQKALFGSLTAQKESTLILENSGKFSTIINKTNDFAKFINNWNIDSKKILYVTVTKEERTMVIGNYKNLKVSSVYGLNVYDILNSTTIIIEDSAIKQLEEIYKK